MIAPQPFFRARGTPFSVLHRIRALCHEGHRVDLVTYPFGETVEIPGLEIIRSRRPPFVRDVKIGPSAAKFLLDLPLYTAARRLLRTRQYDVLHSHEEAAFFAVGLARKYGLPHIYDMHSSLPQQLTNFGKYNLAPIHWLFSRLERHVLTTCDAVITICPELADIALPICGSTPHAMIENTADDRKAFASDGGDIRAELGLELKLVVLYTGTFEAYQGLDLLMQAMSMVAEDHPRAHLLLVGGQPDQIAKLEGLVAEAGLQEFVTFVGTVHPSKIPSYLEASDLIVSPRSSGTNTPLKLYGYMRSGKALVATDMITHTQVLDDEVALLVAPTPDGLANGIATLMQDEALRIRLAGAAQQRAESSYSDHSYIAKVNDLYAAALSRNEDRALPRASTA
jgi:glycosyltransferase involved in cell wall biosynthesis